MSKDKTLVDSINRIIDKLGAKVRLDLRYYLKNFSFLYTSQAVAAVLALLLSVAFARLFTKELYGQWNYIFSIMGLLAVTTLPGMNMAIVQAVARGHDRVFVEGTKVKLKWSLLGSLALLGVGAYYYLNDSTLLGICLLISAPFFPFYENLQVYGAYFAGKKQFSKSAKYVIITQVISMTAAILVLYFTRNLIFILITYLGFFSLLRGLFFKLAVNAVQGTNGDSSALTFGKKMTGLNIISAITTHGDKVILGVFLGFSDLAVYSIARGFQKMVAGTMKSVSSLSFPKLAELGEKEAYSAVKRRYFYLMLVSAIVAGISIIICPFLIPFLYSEQYADSVFYAQILLVSLIVAVPTQIFSLALFPAQRKVKESYKLAVAQIVIRTVLIIGLIQTLGILGLVLAKLITGVLLMVYSWWQVGWIGPRPHTGDN